MSETQRNDIIKVAGKLFLEYGIKSVSIDDICKELHISKKTFYSHFRQKDDLVETVLDEIHKQRNAERPPLPPMSEKNVVDSALAFKNPQTRGGSKIAKFMYDLVKYYPDIHRRFQETCKEETFELLRRHIQNGVEQGWFREGVDSNDDYLRILQEMLFSVQALIAKTSKPALRMSYSEAVADVFLRVVCNEKGWEYYCQNYPNNNNTLHNNNSLK